MSTGPRTLYSFLLMAVTCSAWGQFGGVQSVTLGASNVEISAADIDTDGDLDLFGVFDGQDLKWFDNTDGQGTFGPAQTIVELDDHCMLFKLADIDGDGDVDLILVHDDNNAILIHRNSGTGTFVADGELQLSNTPKAMAVADVDGDGFIDILVTSNFSGGAGVGIFHGSATGFAALVEHTGLHNGPPSACLEVGDLDLIGGLDLVLIGENDTPIIAHNTAGDATIWTAQILPIATGELSYPYRRPQLMDVDADGDLDLVEARGSAVHWLRNVLDEGGAIEFEENVIEPWTTSGDGALGRTACSSGASFVYVPNNPNLPVRWNSYVPLLGDFLYSNDIPAVPRGRRPMLADLNGDANDDLVMVVNDELVWYAATMADDGTTLELPTMDTLCLGGAPVQLATATPAGGRWYGQQIFNGVLHRGNLPGTMDLPTVHAVYQEGGCPMAAESSIRVIQGPEITTTVPAVLCSADAPIVMNAVPSTVQWFGLDGSNVIDPAVWNGGYVVCEFTDATGQMCSDLEGPIMRWNSLPAQLAEVDTLCATDGLANILVIAAPPSNVTWEGPVTNATATGAQFDPSIGAGTYTIILNAEAFAPNQCRNSDTIRVVVDETPHVLFEPMAVYCADGGAIDLLGAQPEGGVWSGAGVSAGQLDPATVGEGTHLVNYFYTSSAGCSTQASTTITVAAAATVTWNADDLLLCPSDDALAFTATPAGGSWSAPVDAEGFFHGADVEPGEHLVHYMYTDPRGCMLDNEPVIVTVGVPKAVTIMEVGRICINTPAFDLVGSGNGVWSGAVSGTGNSVLVDPAALGVGTWPITLTVAPLGECAGETTFDLIVDVCAGMEEGAAMGSSAAPVPFSDRTTLRFGTLVVETLDVFDATGKRVQAFAYRGSQPQQVDLDLSGFPDGVYMVHATGEHGTARLRLVKAH